MSIWINKKRKQLNIFKVNATYDYDTNSYIYKGQHYDHVGMPVLVKSDSFAKALRPSLARVFKKSYEHTPIEYSDIIKPREFSKHSLGFTVTKELVKDDLYGGKVRRKIKKLSIKTQHTIELTGGEVSLDGKEFYVAAMRTDSAADIRQLITALNMILKVAKKNG